jgi:uncharacterized protein (TIGR02444 family)
VLNLARHDSHDSGTEKLQHDNDFWRFSLAVYGRAEVAQECLRLQQALDIDVNVLLFCAWMGTRTFVMDRNDIEAAASAVASWHEHVVRPLRGVRQQVKTLHCDDFESFRTKVKGIELEAEKIEQAILFTISKRLQNGAGADRRDAVTRNVKNYIAIKSGDATAPTLELSAPQLIDAACLLTV